LFGLAVVSLGGCTSIPRGRLAIDSVELAGARSVESGEVLDKLATTATPKFLGIFSGLVNEYSVYDASVLQRDLARIERYYRGRGFFEAHARVARVETTGSNHVRITLVVDEGRPVVDGGIRIEGLSGLPPRIASAVSAAAASALPKGKRFDEAGYRDSIATITRALTDRSYAYATVQADAQVDLASHTIDYVFTASPGIPVTYGPLTIRGLGGDATSKKSEISDDIVRRVVHLREGAPYSTADLRSAEQALLDLEVFSAAHITAQLPDPPQPVVPLVVELEPGKLRAIRVGIGAEFDAIKTDLHVLVGWEDHNLLGDLRDFSVDFTPGVVFYPLAVDNFVAPTDYLLEEKLRVQLRQPSFIEARTVGFVRPEFNVYPLLVGQANNETVVGYVEPKGSIGVNRRFGDHLNVTLAYNVQGEFPFVYKGPRDPSTPTVLFAFPQLTAKLDFSDNPVHPHAGIVANADVQFAVGPTSAWANDLRFQPDVAGYIPIARGVTFALTAALGFLFPYNYGNTIRDKRDIEPPSGDREVNRDLETIYFRGLFSGGPSSNRGFPLRGVAPHAYVPFLNPQTASSQVNRHCDPGNPQLNEKACASPIGGFTEWEASAELRFVVSGPLGAAIFCDAGDVSQYVFPDSGSFRFNYLHMSCGGGVRYDTPVGPLRLDVAYRIPWLQILGQNGEAEAVNYDPTYGTHPRPFDLPINIAFGIGEAF
jgi:outer membrane protein assembly factor BamA